MNAINRRNFLKQSTGAAGALPVLLNAATAPSTRAAAAQAPGPNSQIRVGLIGAGSMGRGDLDCFLGNADVACPVLCDIDDAMLAQGAALCARRGRPKPDTVKDFRRVLERKDVDAVIVATPDHWHALPTVLACQAGKDVYVEKPLALTIDEGHAMVEAARRHRRVVQMGSQWRSARHIQEAAEIVKSGQLGKVSLARGWAWLDWLPDIGRPADSAPPAGVDYDLWLGPAPRRPFNRNRFHFNFRWFWDYAGGLMTDWGVHLINMLLMGMSRDWPRTVCSSGGTYVQTDMRETPDSQIALYEFPDYMLVWEHKSGLAAGLHGRPWGVSWSGTEGTILLNDAGYELVIEKKRATLEPRKAPAAGDPRPPHVRNFLDCIKSRRTPALDVELAHHVSTVAHLGNIAFRSGATIAWDPQTRRIPNHAAADRLVGVAYRAPWKLPYAERSESGA
ncbi:MAG: Gfo/Idh/MocA family oxidoreductase [Verrucomicrobia bacterium]|nr:Gfo/Idh/MocA family oxidoreductase [Verrucomicrobiota bacterium]